MPTKFTFKKEPRETGLRAIGSPGPNTTIKLDGMEIGIISAPFWASKDNLWSVRLMVKQTPSVDDPCDWHWTQLKQRFNTETDARSFLNEHFVNMVAFNLYQMPSDDWTKS